MKLNTGLFTLLLALVIVSCNYEDIQFGDNVYVDDASPVYALEIGYGSYSMARLLQELDTTDLTIDSTSGTVIELQFKVDDITVTKGDVLDETDVISIDQVSENKELRPFSNIDLSSVGGSIQNTSAFSRGLFEIVDSLNQFGANLNFTTEDLIDTLDFEFIADSGTSITEIYFREGSFQFQMTGLDFDYTLRGLNSFFTADDSPITVNENRDEFQPIPLVDTYTDFELARDAADPADDTLNIVQFRLRVDDVLLPPGTTITNSTPVFIQVGTSDLNIRSFDAIRGSFAEQDFSIDPENVKFEGFGDFTNGTIEFQNPQLEFYIDNYLGIPLTVDFSNVRAITNESPEGIQLEIRDPSIGEIRTAQSFVTNYSSLTPSKDTIRINRQTSNIVEVFSEIPNEFIFDVSAVLHNEPGSFVVIPESDDEVFMGLSGTAILPMDATLDNIEQVFDFDGIDSESITGGEIARVQINYKSSIPIEVSAQMGFVSNSNDTTYSITELQLTRNVGENDFDFTELESLNPAALELNEDEIQDLIDSKNIFVTLRLNSPPGERTTLTTNQKIEFRLAALLGLTVEL